MKKLLAISGGLNVLLIGWLLVSECLSHYWQDTSRSLVKVSQELILDSQEKRKIILKQEEETGQIMGTYDSLVEEQFKTIQKLEQENARLARKHLLLM